MNILAIETSTPHASLCLSLNGQSCVQESWQAQRNHDAFLFPALAKAMDCLGTQYLDLILVGSGPGSYGGVRVALAAAVGIATVKKAQVVAICSWWGLAPNGQAVISDAKRGGWTVLRPDGDICVLSLDQLQNEIHNGLTIVTTENEEVLQKADLTAELYQLTPKADGILKSWMGLTDEQRESLKAAPAEPIYVRPPHITEAKRKPWEI